MKDKRLYDYEGKRVLVTGGLGFLGSNLAIRLVELGADVTLMDSMIPAYGATLDNIAPVRHRVSINFSDMRDPYSLSYLVANKDILFNLAGQVSHINSMRDPLNDLDINCRSQLSLLECCRNSNRDLKIVYSSTRQVYGIPQYLPVDEQHPLAPTDVNGINKLAAEMYFSLYARIYGIRCVSLRLTNTYGPRMDLTNLDKGFVGVFIKQALQGEPIAVFGSGAQRRDFNYVSDVVDALLLAGQADHLDGSVFNLGYPHSYSIIQFLNILRHIVPLDYTCTPFPSERKAIDIGDYTGDFSKFQEATGWTPKVDLLEGLQKTIAYFHEHVKPAIESPSASY